jgi:translocation and assembly module TamB
VRALRVERYAIAQARASWRAGPDASSPLSLEIDATDAREATAAGPRRIDALTLQLDGSLSEHRLTVDASSPVRPPAWSQKMADTGGASVGAASASGGSTLRLRGSGSWQALPLDGASAGRWRARLDEARVAARTEREAGLGPRTAAPGTRDGTRDGARDGARTDALDARDLRATVTFDRAFTPSDVELEPGRVNLLGAGLRWQVARWRREGQRLDVDAALEPLPVAPLIARLNPGMGVGGDLHIGGTLAVRSHAGGTDVEALIERQRGDLELTDGEGKQSFGLSTLRLGLVAKDGTWHITQAVAGNNLGVLAGAQTMRVPASTRWPSDTTPLEGVMSWRVENLSALAPWLPPGWRVGGALDADATFGGRFGAPEYTGRVIGRDLGLRNVLQGVDVREGELRLTLRGDDARIERLVFKGGDGTLEVTGGATFGAAPVMRVRIDADRFQWLGRVDRRVVASGRANVELSRDSVQAQAALKVDEGLFDLSRRDAPSLDSDVTVVRADPVDATDDDDKDAPAPGVPAARGPLRNARLAVTLDLGDKLVLRGRGLNTTLGGAVALTSPGNRLAVNGSIRATRGTYKAYGQNLDITRGEIVFSGTPDNPRLAIAAQRPNLDVVVGVAITGTAQNPRVRLYSEPEMNDTDKLAWLVLGRAPEGLGRADTAILQRAALALWAGEDGEAPSDAVLRTLGIDEFSIGQSGSGDVRDTVVRVGKQIGRRWYVGYERGVNASTGTWQVIYRIAQRLTVRAQSGSDRALDAIWTWRW